MTNKAKSFDKKLRELIEEELVSQELMRSAQRQSMCIELESYRICEDVLENIRASISEHYNTC